MYYILSILIITTPGRVSSPNLEHFRLRVEALRTGLKEGPPVKSLGPTNEIRYVHLSSLEYPKNSRLKLSRIRQLWELYYDCLNSQLQVLSSRSLRPVAISLYEGGSARLECLFCQSPRNGPGSVKWFHQRTLSGAHIQIEDVNMINKDDSDSLIIYDAGPEDAGIYYCMSGNTKTSLYFVHVFNDEEPLLQVKRENTFSNPTEILDGIVLQTVWSDWSSCTRCDKVGRRLKFGACFVSASSPSFISRYNETYTLLEYFDNGLPCRSPLLPHWFTKMDLVRNIPNKVFLGYCKEACTDTFFEVRDEKGLLMNIVNNSAGVFSPLQTPPKLIWDVERKTIFIEIGRPLTVTCPGKKNADVLVEWFLNKSTRVYFSEPDGPRSRIWTDPRGRLVIAEVLKDDRSLFSCWQKGDMIGVIRVVPLDPSLIEIDQHVILIGTLIILLLFLFIFVKVLILRETASFAKNKTYKSIYLSLVSFNITIFR